MRYLLALVLSLVLASPALAAFEGPGTKADITKAAQVLSAVDGAPCILEGHVLEKVTGSDDKYIFHDDSGKVIVDIDHKVFADQKVTPTSRVRLSGKVDKHKTRESTVDVKHLQLL